MSSIDASPLLSSEPSTLWRVDATEGADMDGFLLHQRSEKQSSKEIEARTLAAEHDTSEPARTARQSAALSPRAHLHVQPATTGLSCTAPLSDLSRPLLLRVRYLLWRAALGEVCGTFLLIFVACGTPITSHSLSTATTTALNATSPLLTLLINNLTVALLVIGLTYSLASVSGAHVNPAVTLALWTSHHTSARKLAVYVVAQALGAVLALLALVLCYNGDWTVLQHAPVGRAAQASLYSVFAMEFLLTFTLVFIILRVSFDNIEAEKRHMSEYRAVIGSAVGLTIAPSTNARLGYAPMAIGFAVLVLGVLGGGVSGSAMNPIRYAVPAVLAGQWDVWLAVYVLGELGGACAAVGLGQVFDATGRVAERWAERAAVLRQAQLQHGPGAVASLGGTVAANGDVVVNAHHVWNGSDLEAGKKVDDDRRAYA